MASDLPEDRLEIDSAQALWDWLADHHGQEAGVWLVTWKKAAGAAYVSRDAVLDALVAYGWTDGRRLKHPDPARTMQRIAPRGQPVWAESYRKRAEQLIAEGRMQAPGLASVEAAKTAGTWQAWQDVDDLMVPEDLARALVARPNAAPWFDASAPSYRRNVLRFLRAAKTPETRAKRCAAIADHAGRGEKLPQY